MFSVVLLAIVATALAAPQRPFDEAPEPYNFQYKVDNPPTNTFFGQNEGGDGIGRVSGAYFVYLPDGRLMTVEYTADEQGFKPRVSFQQNAFRPALAALG